MKNYSLKKRYLAKLFANLIGLGISLVTQAIIPRGLGSRAYGDFSFLSNFFSKLMPFFSMSTSIGFYTKISQRQDEFALVSFYFQFTGLAFIVLIFFVQASWFTGAADIFWVDQKMGYVYMAAIFAMLTWLAQILTSIADACGLTVSTELAKIAQKFLGLALILALFFSKNFSLTNFFLYHYSILLFLVTLFIWIITKNKQSFFKKWKLTHEQIYGYVKELYQYSHPLFVYSLVGMVIGILDRWVLQKFGGSVQQGFFGLSYQVGAICFLFTSAMTSLITREFSIVHAMNNRTEMAALFRRYIPLLYSIAAFFGCFASVQAAKITYIFGGQQFAGAAVPMMIMAFYPIHQTYGQLSGSVFYATGQTKLYRNIGLLFMFAGLPVLYFMLAPSEKMGLNAGAAGLALKFVLLQFVGVNVQLYFNAKYLNFKFSRYFFHQIICVVFLVGLALICKFFFDAFVGIQGNIFLSFFLSGLLYSVLVLTMMWIFPMVFGLKRNDLGNFIETGKSFINRKK